MTDTPEPAPAHAMFKVLAALAELGEDTAAAVADKAGLGYSTATSKLRAWETTGQAERVHTDSKRAVWRLTDAGRATVGAANAQPPTGTSTGTGTDSPPSPSTDDLADPTGASAAPQEGPAPQGGTSEAGGEHAEAIDTAPTPPPLPADPPASSDCPPAQQTEPTPDAPAISSDPAADTDEQTPPAGEKTDPPEAATPRGGSGPAARPRRAMGSLRAAVLDVLEAHPDRAFKTGELCRLIDAANAGTDARKASAGAIANAADKLVIAGKAIRTADKPATVQLAPTP
ncbi:MULTISPECIES: MarR family winged helix-turn-helix transcriptional regulator [unclassified Micromonospora]|uniref:MarR family winged helix-turn-helix transcriptional regulator n=1 Tax=unclassified Micromonospora TaxID=2617518 RepID=UPI001C226049|nr:MULTISPECIES: MarR family winged helix-turn-helix transcriptional regulator [unclassified Micromonospora]MBU8857747.1 MarR family transcriptional regulator [Micromonospora sp. WMMB482]MDM4783374.1 MarR family transcriptional regulator [Micromonospora sp. b486]